MVVQKLEDRAVNNIWVDEWYRGVPSGRLGHNDALF
jgi:hypothetical protein